MSLSVGAAFGATNNLALVSAARSQIGVTVRYVPSYQKLAYPNGDVPREQGVCVDVVIRAMRDAKRGDLQQLVHEDMKAHFDAYPKNWGLKTTDRNIDHLGSGTREENSLFVYPLPGQFRIK